MANNRNDATAGSRADGPFRGRIRALVEHPLFQPMVIGLIMFNGLVIIMETYDAGNRLLFALDRIIIWLFVLEVLLKIAGLGPRRYFGSGWNVFDFTIVAASLAFYSTSLVSVLRLVRVLRLIRMIPAIPALRKIIDSLMKSVPALTGILGLTFLIFSIYAIIGTTFFREALPYEYFGSFHHALFTLVQVVTFESWASQVARPVIEQLPWAWVYFVSFIIVGALVILNLVVAVILSYLNQEEDTHQQSQLDRLVQENEELRHDIRDIKTLLTEQRNKPEA
ncbi:ion transporter [Paenibacillus sp. IB182496]|uniref:Ion transporter n=2 Tax=Paenibacillus sabuli TaxID=2772509 RepID=A0A927BT42_9BACL|nr:ion transporter [Paenibacillus sabuli]